MKEIFKLGGDPSKSKYLFLGDYVDRGSYAVEVILTLYALKINFPNSVFMLRGNHECRQMTSFHCFRDECLKKYDQEIYDLIMDSFDRLPIACIINGQFLALHGGISPDFLNILDINKYNRFEEPPQVGSICDILWADPVDNNSGLQNKVWEMNQSRGCSYYFGVVAINEFLKANNLISLIRAHEAQYEGFKAYVWQNKDFPQVITLFSAPNYCGSYANKGAIMKLHNNEMKVYQYNFTPKPDLLLQRGDAFTWSLPLISKSLIEMFIGFLAYTNDVVLDNKKKNAVDISMLEDSVLDALEIDKQEAENLDNEIKPSFLEQLVEDQKAKKRLSNKQLIQGIKNNPNLQIFQEQNNPNDSILNESFPEHFHYMKKEDSANERRPSKDDVLTHN